MNKSGRSGFTLTEMLVVVAIIVVLAGIAVPVTLNVLTDAKKDVAMAQMRGPIATAVKTYMLRQGVPPTTIEELLSPALGGNGTLTADAITDPWGNPYQIAITSDDPDNFLFEIYSQGPSPGNPNSQITLQSQ
jgi:general secretion pathway protein G